MNMKNNNYWKNLTLMLAGVLVLAILFSLSPLRVSAQENNVCCERTTSGAFCQNVPVSECAPGSNAVPTSCEATSFCRAGTCYDSSEGTCLDNTPQIVCNENGGIWSEESPPQCGLGCCVLGDQAAFVTLVRCKKLSSFLGLETNYDSSFSSELACIQSVQGTEKGACVYEFEFERTCKMTTRNECEGSSQNVNGAVSGGEFYAGTLCSDEELGTNCGPSTQTTCLPGKDEVYFLDTCGNIANIYDSSKIRDKEYWSEIKSKDESCNPLNGNIENANCGNCNYIQGSYCRNEENAKARATYGDFICADLNCRDSNGEVRRHGESWCANDDRTPGDGENRVGERFFRQICNNGMIITEACEDFRNQECIQDSVETDYGDFTQAACRVNRWQDCLAQAEQDDCENSDRRDCYWDPEVILFPDVSEDGTCLPENPPGLEFWTENALAHCAQANTECVVQFEKGLFGGESCKENCECLTEEWEKNHVQACMALGDCGPKLNWINEKGRNESYTITRS